MSLWNQDSQNQNNWLSRAIELTKRFVWYGLLFGLIGVALMMGFFGSIALIANRSLGIVAFLFLVLPSFLGAGFAIFKLKPYFEKKEPKLEQLPVSSIYAEDQQELENVWRRGLSLKGREKQEFERAVYSTRSALISLGEDAAMSRELFDIRQAIREDLPRALDLHLSSPHSEKTSAVFIQNASLIIERMEHIAHLKTQENLRSLQSNATYLQDKYQPSMPQTLLEPTATPFPDLPKEEPIAARLKKR